MKKNKYLSILLVLMLTIVSCEDYLDINTSPNAPSAETVNPELVLAATQNESYKVLAGNMMLMGNLMMNNWSNDIFGAPSSTFFNELTYNVNPDFYANIFQRLYLRTSEYTYIIDNKDPKYDNYRAIALIMKSFYFQYLVDLYNNVPYSEAHLRGTNISAAYDDAKDIYRDLIVKLDEAISLINNPSLEALNPEENDAMLQGDMNLWMKFANTLKLRILLRESGLSESSDYINQEFAKLSGAQFLDQGDDIVINPGYSNATDKQSPVWEFFGFTPSGNPADTRMAASSYAIDLMDGLADDRLGRIYSLNLQGIYDGVLQGETLGDASNPASTSKIGPGILKSFSQNGLIMTAAEGLLLQAEAIEKGFLSGSANTKYEAAITESFRVLGVSDYASKAMTYYSKADVAYDDAPNKLLAIMTQKSIALNSINPTESWIEYTRTGYPLVPLSSIANTSTGDRPVRLQYPSSEFQRNSSNVQIVDPFTSQVFWNN